MAPLRARRPVEPPRAQRAADDELRAAIKNVDLDTFAQLLKKTVAPPGRHEI